MVFPDNDYLTFAVDAKNFKIPSTVNSISISTVNENAFYITLLVEEWGN